MSFASLALESARAAGGAGVLRSMHSGYHKDVFLLPDNIAPSRTGASREGLRLGERLRRRALWRHVFGFHHGLQPDFSPEEGTLTRLPTLPMHFPGRSIRKSIGPPKFIERRENRGGQGVLGPPGGGPAPAQCQAGATSTGFPVRSWVASRRRAPSTQPVHDAYFVPWAQRIQLAFTGDFVNSEGSMWRPHATQWIWGASFLGWAGPSRAFRSRLVSRFSRFIGADSSKTTTSRNSF